MTNAPTSASGSGPVMRGLHSMQTRRQLAIGVALTACVVVGVKILNNDRRKKAYAEFYKNYDAEKSFERMRAKGLFQSC